MTSASDRDYYAKRARDERALEKAARNPESARAHSDMAAHYEALLLNDNADESLNQTHAG